MKCPFKGLAKRRNQADLPDEDLALFCPSGFRPVPRMPHLHVQLCCRYMHISAGTCIIRDSIEAVTWLKLSSMRGANQDGTNAADHKGLIFQGAGTVIPMVSKRSITCWLCTHVVVAI